MLALPIVGNALPLAAWPAEWNLSAERAFHLCGQAWFLWGMWWLLMAFFSKSTKRRENPWQRLEHVLPTALGFVLLFRDQWRPAWLNRVVFADLPALSALAVVVTVVGLLFAAWARLALGGNWSGSITIKKGHQLIRRGPYRFIRHPIYTGMLVALVGTAVAQQQVRGLVAVVVVLLAFYRKACREESFLSEEFGDSYVEHRQHTGMFLPRLS